MIKKIQFLFLAVAAIGLIYGTLVIITLQTKVMTLEKTQREQKQSIAEQKNDFDRQISSLNNDLTNNQEEIKNLNQQIVLSQRKMVLGTTTKETPVNVVEKLSPQIKTVTISQKEVIEKLVEKNQVSLTIQGVGSYMVDLESGDTAWDVLKRASEQNHFALEYEMYSFGVFVKSIGGIVPAANQYWAFYYNGQYSMVGASSQPASKDDSIFWQLASF